MLDRNSNPLEVGDYVTFLAGTELGIGRVMGLSSFLEIERFYFANKEWGVFPVSYRTTRSSGVIRIAFTDLPGPLQDVFVGKK